MEVQTRKLRKKAAIYLNTTLKEGLYEVRNALLNPHLTLKFRKTNFTKMNNRKISR